MKKFKLILATFVAFVTAFFGSKALAYDITVTGGSGEYESYQVFTGTLADDGKTLSNIEWGNGITPAGQTALQNKYGATSAATLAEKMEKFTTEEAEQFAKDAAAYLTNPGGLTGLDAGYYLVQNKTVGDNKAYTNYILEVVKNVTVQAKTDVPTVEKKVKDVNDTTKEESGWQDSADYDIDDNVPFQLTATLPSNFATYDTYYLELVDTISAGLTYNNDAKVFLVNGATETEVTDRFTVADNGLNFKIDDAKTLPGVTASSKIVVRYSAKLNENAKIGAEGNPNEVKLVYSNNPNYTGGGNNRPTGETPKDKVIVFTYKTDVNKVDQDGDPLKGAGFTLYKKVDGAWKAVKELTAGEATTFEFKGIDDGDYKLVETTVPSGYNKAADVEFTVSATHSEVADEPVLLTFESSNAKVSADKNSGTLTTDVENKKGSILPSTGSIGTTLFYLIGSVLVVGAGILLVTKKRMDSK